MASEQQDLTYAAIDVGTTSIKAVLFDASGQERVVGRASVSVDRPQPGWAEQDMHAVWHAVTALLAKLAQAADRPPTALAVTTQGDGCWLADRQGEPVRPAILWNDGRANARVASWLADGTLRRMHELGHFTGFAGIPSAILPWLAENEPDVLARASSVFTCGSWVYRRLTGHCAIDPSDAAVPFMAPRSQTYDAALMAVTGLEAMESMLPPIAADKRPSHGLLRAVAEAAGLPVGLPIVLAPYDVPAAALGAGCVQPGDMLMVLGTTFLTGSVVCDHAAPPFGGTNVPLGRTGRQLQFFPALVGMESLAWAARMLGFASVEAAVDAALGAEARGAIFLPYLSPAGERAPFVDPHIKGGFARLSLEHTPDQLMRAVLEGVTMALLDCVRASGGGQRLSVCGGGANSDGWCQLLADVTGMEVRRPASSELSARGAALAALAALNGEEELAVALRWGDVARVWSPNASRTAHYQAVYSEFLLIRYTGRQGRTQIAGLA